MLPTTRRIHSAGPVSGPADCPFCQIVAGAAPAEVVCESTDWIAFFPDAPATPGHTLVIPRRHVPDFLELDENTAANLMTGVVRVGRAIRAALDPDGLNLITSVGEAAEQSVFHLHFHLVPRTIGDAIGHIWPPKTTMSESLKDDLADRIRGECAS